MGAFAPTSSEAFEEGKRSYRAGYTCCPFGRFEDRYHWERGFEAAKDEDKYRAG